MRRTRFLTTGALFMGVIITLGAIGIANGLWSHTLTVAGTVETGDLDIAWNCGWTNDDGIVQVIDNPTSAQSCNNPSFTEPAGDNGGDPHGNATIANGAGYDFPYTDPFTVKNVGRCTIAFHPDHPEVVRVLLENGYPSYECTFSLGLSNTGTIPVNVIGVAFNLSNSIAIEFLGGGSAPGHPACIVPSGLNGTELSGDFRDAQVDPGQDALVICTVHVTQHAEQSSGCDNTGFHHDGPGFIPGYALDKDFNCTSQTTYSFDMKVCAAQWNEATDPAACVEAAENEGP